MLIWRRRRWQYMRGMLKPALHLGSAGGVRLALPALPERLGIRCRDHQDQTLIRWHRGGVKAFWRWRSRSRGGRPAIPREIRDLIREMSRANGLWGALRIQGELLKLGIEVAQSTVAKYMIRRLRRRGQSWATFLRNYADGIAAVDLFVVP